MFSIRALSNPGNEASIEKGPLPSLFIEAAALPVMADVRGSYVRW